MTGFWLTSITYKDAQSFSSLKSSITPSSEIPHYARRSSCKFSHKEAATATILAPWFLINVSLMSIDISLFSMHSFKYVSISAKNSGSRSVWSSSISLTYTFYGWSIILGFKSSSSMSYGVLRSLDNIILFIPP